MSILNVNQIQPVGGGNTITVSANDVNFSGNISIGSSFVGTASTATLATISQGLTGTPDIIVNNIQSGVVTATTFIGNGSGLTGVTASGSGINIKDSGSTVGVAATVDFGTNLNVSPASAGIVTVTVGDTDFEIVDKIVHTSDTDTALRFPAADTFSVETAGTERLRVTSAGNIGIGTDNPLQKLHLLDTTSANIYLQTHNAGTGSTAGVYFRTSDSSTADGFFKTAIVLEDDGSSWARGKLHILQDNTADASNATLDDSVLTINQSGQIGIGTDNPGNVLHLQKNGGDAILELQNSGNGNHSGIFFVRESSGGVNKGAANIHVESNTSGSGSALVFGCGSNISPTGSERLRITSGGLVGIGTDNPLNGLDLNQSEGRFRVNRFSHLLMQNKNNSTTNYWGISVRNNGDIDFGYGIPDVNNLIGGDKLTITSAGNVGINTTDPQSRLEVFTDDDTDFGNSSNTNNTNSLIRLFNKNGTDNTAVNNYVGIRFDVANGATSSAWLSYVRTGNNTGAFQFKARNAASSYPEVARILSSGGITFNGDTTQANALDDYEEGTLNWRLQRTGAIGSGSNNNDTSITYTKIGNRVYVSGYLYTENTGGSTGVTVELRDNANTNNVATLPYVPNQAGGFPITGTRTINDNYRNMAVTFIQGQSQVYIYTDDGNNAYLKNTNNVQINSTQTHLVIQFCGSYTTNS